MVNISELSLMDRGYHYQSIGLAFLKETTKIEKGMENPSKDDVPYNLTDEQISAFQALIDKTEQEAPELEVLNDDYLMGGLTLMFGQPVMASGDIRRFASGMLANIMILAVKNFDLAFDNGDKQGLVETIFTEDCLSWSCINNHGYETPLLRELNDEQIQILKESNSPRASLYLARELPFNDGMLLEGVEYNHLTLERSLAQNDGLCLEFILQSKGFSLATICAGVNENDVDISGISEQQQFEIEQRINDYSRKIKELEDEGYPKERVFTLDP